MNEVIWLEVERAFATGVEATRRVCEVASMFGLGVDRRKIVQVVPRVRVPIAGGSVVFITGASGGGKTTLLRLIGEVLRERGDVRVVDFAKMWDVGCGMSDVRKAGNRAKPQAAEGSIVEEIGGTLEEAVRWLSLAGLNDAFVMLRKEGELSDGQRYRFKLARAMAECEEMWDVGCGMSDVKKPGEGDAASTGRRAPLTVVLADEFAATLDRLTAGVIGRNVRKWVDRKKVGSGKSEVGSEETGEPSPGGEDAATLSQGERGGVCFVAVSTHDDLLEWLEPDVLVVQEPGEGIGVHLRERND